MHSLTDVHGQLTYLCSPRRCSVRSARLIMHRCAGTLVHKPQSSRYAPVLRRNFVHSMFPHMSRLHCSRSTSSCISIRDKEFGAFLHPRTRQRLREAQLHTPLVRAVSLPRRTHSRDPVDQKPSKMADSHPWRAEGNLWYRRLRSALYHRAFLPQAGQEVFLPSFLHHPVRTRRAITCPQVTSIFRQHTCFRRVLHYDMFSHHIRSAMDIPPSGILWPRYPATHVPIPHQRRRSSACRQPANARTR